MSKTLHSIYLFFGYIYCFFWLNIYRLRDFVFKPKEDSILFVAHPDDDTLFFHTYIKEYKPYVVLLTTGWSLRRIPGFKRNMKRYGVKFRIYGLESKDTRTNLLDKYIKESLNLGNFKNITTHNKTGEYGHEMHQRVHSAVLKSVDGKIICPVEEKNLSNYPLPEDVIDEKTFRFKKYYNTELFVLDMYDRWICNEKLE